MDEKYDFQQDKRQMAAARLRLVDRRLKKIVDKKVAVTGVYRGQHQMLIHMYFHKFCSQSELAEHMNISPAAVAVTLKKLEKGGYIERIIQPEDNRVNKIEITQKGHDIVSKTLRVFIEIEHAMFCDFTEEELLVFNKFAERIYYNLDKLHEDL